MKENNFVQQRNNLVNTLKYKGITDNKVLEAMLKVPRDEFIESNLKSSSYVDAPQPIGDGQTISQPYIVALMTEHLRLKGCEKVLELGTGCGYQTAILCELAKEVYSIERIESLCSKSKENLKKLGYTNAHLFLGDGTLGLPEYAPYDAIIVTATSPEIPSPLKSQLASGGRMVIPVGKSSPQELIVVIRQGDTFSLNYICGVSFVPLIGKYAWSE